MKALGISRQHWILFAGPVLILYTLGTGMSASAVRACIMALVFWLAPLFRRKQDGPSALALAAILILAVDPAQLADPGFMLSFGIVGGLMLLYGPLVEPLHSRVSLDPWRVQEESRPMRWVRGAATHGATLVAASVAAWLVGTPLTAAFFNNVSFVSLVANLLVIPLTAVILFTGCLSLCLGAWSGFLAEIFNHANRLFTTTLLWLVDMFNAWPQGHVFVKTPPVVWILMWYAIVGAGVLGSGRFRRAALVTGAAALVVGLGVFATDRSAAVELTQASDSVVALVNVPGGGDVLVNTGPAWSSRKVLRWLHTRGVDRLQAIAITSPRADMAGGAALILEQVPVEEIWTVPYEGRSPAFREVARIAAAKNIPVRRLAFGDRGELTGRHRIGRSFIPAAIVRTRTPATRPWRCGWRGVVRRSFIWIRGARRGGRRCWRDRSISRPARWSSATSRVSAAESKSCRRRRAWWSWRTGRR